MHVSRRYFIKSTGAVAAYCGLCPGDLLQAASAPAVRRGKTLVVIFLRGGMDGLNFAVPFGDKSYYDLRSRIAIPAPGRENGALDLDGFFGLHPSAAALTPFLTQGEGAILQAVGYDHNTRSHFEEQDTWETGVIGNTVHSDGWLNRHLATSQGHGPIRAVSLGDNLPRILRGNASAFAIRGLSDLGLSGSPEKNAHVLAALEHAYCTPPPKHRLHDARDLVQQTGRDTLEATRLLSRISEQAHEPKMPYPDTGLAKKLEAAARIIQADVGLEVAEIDYGGWDTHNNQGGAEGAFADRVRVLSEAVAAFHHNMGDRMKDVMLVTLSDFGRTAAENGSAGTDHGWANCMLALGGPALNATKPGGSPVMGTWPGLAKEQLNQGRDLKHTTDFRDVLAEIVHCHLGNDRLKTVLPGHPFKPVGLCG